MADLGVVGKLLKKVSEVKDLPRGAARAPQNGPLSKEFQIRFAAIVLALLTAAAFVFAFINFDKEREFEVPDDGVSWVNQDTVIQAQRVEQPPSTAQFDDADRHLSERGQSQKRNHERRLHEIGQRASQEQTEY